MLLFPIWGTALAQTEQPGTDDTVAPAQPGPARQRSSARRSAPPAITEPRPTAASPDKPSSPEASGNWFGGFLSGPAAEPNSATTADQPDPAAPEPAAEQVRPTREPRRARPRATRQARAPSEPPLLLSMQQALVGPINPARWGFSRIRDPAPDAGLAAWLGGQRVTSGSETADSDVAMTAAIPPPSRLVLRSCPLSRAVYRNAAAPQFEFKVTFARPGEGDAVDEVGEFTNVRTGSRYPVSLSYARAGSNGFLTFRLVPPDNRVEGATPEISTRVFSVSVGRGLVNGLPDPSSVAPEVLLVPDLPAETVRAGDAPQAARAEFMPFDRLDLAGCRPR
jgi:hypothetical protein